jgi:hypothetical protein
VEGFSTPQYTKRTANAARQAPPHWHTEPLPGRPWDLRSSGSAPQPCQSNTPPNSHPSDPHDHHRATPSGLHRLPPFKPAQICTISTLPGHITQACQAPPGPRPHACTGLHNIHPVRPHRSGLHDLCSARPHPLRPTKLAIHTLHTQTISAKPGPSCLHNLYWDHAPKACQATNPQTCTISTLASPRPSDSPGPGSKGQLVRLNEKPHP